MFGFWSKISWAKSKDPRIQIEMGIENEIRVLWGNGPLTWKLLRFYGSRFSSYKKRVWLSKKHLPTWVSLSDWEKPYPWMVAWYSYHGGSSFTVKMVKEIEKKKKKGRKTWLQTVNCTDFKVPGVEGWWFDIDFQWKHWPILVGLATIMINQWST